MSEQDLVSIIIPVYNSEQYLARCVDSALAQTYANIEVVLVDDGSTDSCPAICDEYARRYPQVRTVHRKNGGLSAARNTGIEAAQGAWLYFMDSDDWCEPFIIEHCMAKIAESGADIVIFDHISVGHRIDDGLIEVEMEEGLHTPLEALDALYRDRIDFGIWHFLFARRFYDEIRFPEGETCEDVAILHEIIDSARAIYVLHEIGYHYIWREGCITQEGSYRIHGWEAYQTMGMILYAQQHHPELVRPAKQRAARKAIAYAKGAIWNKSPEEIKLMHAIITGGSLDPSGLTFKQRLNWNLFSISPKLDEWFIRSVAQIRAARRTLLKALLPSARHQ